MTWYPDRTYGGRTYVPGTAPTDNGLELFGYVSFVPGADRGEPSTSHAARRFHRRDGRAQPRLGASTSTTT